MEENRKISIFIVRHAISHFIYRAKHKLNIMMHFYYAQESPELIIYTKNEIDIRSVTFPKNSALYSVEIFVYTTSVKLFFIAAYNLFQCFSD